MVKAYIRATGSYVPERKMSNDDLSKIVETSDEWIFSHTGIRNRHLAAADEATSDLACIAARRALETGGIEASEIDLIILATSTPDFPGLPSTACIVQDMIGAVNAGAMDLSAACTGFVYALETANSFIRSGSAKNILVIGSEIFSRILNWKDRNTCVLFGDGAGAVVLSACDEHEDRGVIGSILRSEGCGARALERTAGGTKIPYVPGKTPHEDLFIRMDGRKVYTFAVRVICDTISKLLENNSVSFDEIARIVPHQANIRILEAAAKRFQIPMDIFYTNIDEYANTSAASIPLALDEMNTRGLLKRGDLIMTVGFGSGLTYGGNLLRW